MADFFKSTPPTPSPVKTGFEPKPHCPAEKPINTYRPDSERMQPKRDFEKPDRFEEKVESPRIEMPPQRFLQVHNSYLITQNEEGIVIIDQHALHERVIYEKLYKQLQAGRILSQRCLIPEIIDVTAEQMAVIENAKEMLEELGILLESFGPRSVAVQGFPVLLERVSPVAFITDLLDTLAGQLGKLSREEMYHDLLDMMACKAAVKAGNSLDETEIESLLQQLDTVDRSGNCPHGRPTTIRLSLAQLEKQFKRT
jgi:DNA mismatch repair protein MutL